MPTSGLTSAPSELGTFLSTFEQSRRRLREMEAEQAKSGGGQNGMDRYMESERTKQLQQLRDSVSSCRMQLAELEKEVAQTENGNSSFNELDGLPMGGKSPSSARRGGNNKWNPPSPEEKAYVRQVLDVNNSGFTVDGSKADFVDPESNMGDNYADEYRDHPSFARPNGNAGGGNGNRRGSDDFVNSARTSRTAWNHADLRDVSTKSAAMDELSALRAQGMYRDQSSRTANSIEIIEEARANITVDDVDPSRFDDSHEEWDVASSIFANKAWGISRREQVKKYGKLCCYVAAVVATIAMLGGLVGKEAQANAAAAGEGLGGGAQNEASNGHKRLDDIKNRIIQSGVTEEAKLTLEKGKPAPPQYRALHWIVEHDAMGLDPDDPFLLQRYALAAFHYSSQDNKSDGEKDDAPRDKTNWLTMRGICAWRGVQCHHRPGTPPDSTTYDDNGGVTHLEISRTHRVAGPLIPELFRALTELRILDLSENDITGTLGTEIGRLTQLENLKLGKNELEGTIPSEVGEMVELQDLDLSENALGGSIPSEIGNLAKLVGLGLFDNVLSGSIPAALGQLTKMEVLYLDSNEITGTLPQSFYDMKALYDVRLRDNHLSGTIALALGEMRALKLLYLDSNDFTGSIPTHLGNLGELTQLHLFKNQLSGTIPHEVGGLRKLEHFSVNDNALTGPIPEHLSSMQTVRDLYLYGNKLTGTIPPELAGDTDGSIEDFGMAALADLRLFDNELRGKIPSRLGNLVHLEHLSLENNKFTGAVPSELGNLANLAKLRLDGNQLTGLVPPEVCHLTEDGGGGVLAEFLSDCGGDRPLVECECCTECAEPGSGRR